MFEKLNARIDQLSSQAANDKAEDFSIPQFDGGVDPTSWLCRAEQFFEIHETHAADRVSLASFHLEGDAQLWYQLLKQEAVYISWNEFKEGLHSSVAPPSLPRVPIKKMTIEELNERKKKGLCFKCNEKFSPSHGCKRLFLIQANFDDSDKDIKMEIEGDEVVEQTETTPGISFHAMVGTQTPETMRVMGRLVQKVVTVLIDSGSTHNFI
ncbi:uncharacterized protein LOC127899837 [Citrus sinensis]|uniref:uncharacterized protein LOC127899837 n=1 Tax=Citrus sinensis TaxID=2711 RepID=UPI002278EF70|nr:uncharacterized protein LOC127899837 [Citrus sinensis]